MSAPRSSATPATAAPRQTGKWIQFGLLGFAGLAVVGILALWISGKSDPPAPPAVGPTAEEQRALDLQTALTTARGRLDAGDLQGALTALAEAQRLDPENAAARSLRAEVDRVSLDLASAAEREQRVSEGLILARDEYSKKHYEAAIAAAKGVLALVPDHPEAAKLSTDSEAAWNRQKEREKAQKSGREATEAAAAAVPAPLPPPVKPIAPAPVAVPAPDATVNIDFYSEVSEGVLTVYSGERQIYREPFKFVKKTGLLSKEKIPGALAAERKLPAGAVALRVYVTLPGKPTKAIVLDENLVGGSTRQLVIRVDADARVEARLE